MANQSKVNDPRFWEKWRNSGAVGTIEDAKGRACISRRACISKNLTRKLTAYRLNGKIHFDASAIGRLYRMSSGDWEIAKVYAGTAVLDALQNKKDDISSRDIRKAEGNIAEPINLMLGGKDIWDDVRYIGLNVPNMLPEGVAFRRALSAWDAAKTRNAMSSAREGKLPAYTLVDKIEYTEKSVLGNYQVTIPFRYDPSKKEVEAIARNLANFVSQETGTAQELRDISDGSEFLAHVQYFVQDRNDGKTDPLLAGANYRVAKEFGNRIRISPEMFCPHDKGTLEKYVGSLKAAR